MRARQAFFAVAIFLGCAAVDAAASPLIPVPSGAFLQANRGLDTVRWRHRHYRDFFWRERGDTVGRSDADAFSSRPRRVTLPVRSLPRALKSSGSILRVVADG